jgi:hypothetical protein
MLAFVQVNRWLNQLMAKFAATANGADLQPAARSTHQATHVLTRLLQYAIASGHFSVIRVYGVLMACITTQMWHVRVLLAAFTKRV